MRFAGAMLLGLAISAPLILAMAAATLLHRNDKPPYCVASHTALVQVGVACSDGVCELPVVVQVCDRAVTATHD